MESAYKPGSVVSSHSSRARVTTRLKQPTRVQRGPRQRTPIWSCSERGLPCRNLLPAARCALTAPFHPYLCQNMTIGGMLSVALSVGSRPPGVTWHSALWSPDFPPLSTQYHLRKYREKTAVAAQPTPRIDYHEIISCLKIIFIKISLKVAKKFSRLIYCLRERAKAYNSFFW